ncbi:MAG TPA: hypothetical protein VMZ26_03750 [Pyrinomonadaceae bacterium]|nr:hypothetical protein [Pyrinomonadaceae bacterium]
MTNKLIKVLIPLVLIGALIIAGIVIVGSAAMYAGAINVSISAYNHYRLNDTERTLLEERALTRVHEKIREDRVDDLRPDILKTQISVDSIVNEMKKAKEKFGNPTTSEFFRAAPPEPAERYYPGVSGTAYYLFYFTTTEKGDFSEDIEFVLTDDGEVKIRSYGATEMIDWQKRARERERVVNQLFPRELRVPLGSRFIQIRY